MQIIDKFSEAFQGLAASKMTIRMYINHVSFTKAVVNVFKMKAGMYVHFVQDENDWYLFVDNDKTGFKLVRHDYRGASLSCSCSPAIALFQQTTKYFDLPISFYLRATNKEVRGCKLIQIWTSKPALNDKNKHK